MNREALTTGEVAKLLGIGVGTIKKLVDNGQLTGMCVPGSKHRRIWLPDVKRFAAANGIPIGEK